MSKSCSIRFEEFDVNLSLLISSWLLVSKHHNACSLIGEDFLMLPSRYQNLRKSHLLHPWIKLCVARVNMAGTFCKFFLKGYLRVLLLINYFSREISRRQLCMYVSGKNLYLKILDQKNFTQKCRIQALSKQLSWLMSENLKKCTTFFLAIILKLLVSSNC